MHCSSLCRFAIPRQDLASKDCIDSEHKPTLQHESPTRAEKMQDWEACVRHQRITMTIYYLSERSIMDMVFTQKRWHIVSVSSSKVTVSTFSSPSFHFYAFVDTDHRRVNTRPIRKNFSPDRYDFVPIVFKSSSCKRGLNSWFSRFQFSEFWSNGLASSVFIFAPGLLRFFSCLRLCKGWNIFRYRLLNFDLRKSLWFIKANRVG